MEKEVDLGEVIREITKTEREIINEFEKAEIEMGKQKAGIGEKCSNLLKNEKNKTAQEEKKILEDAEKEGDKRTKEIILKKQKEIKKFKEVVEKNKKQIINKALEKVVEEVKNAFSAERF